MKPFLTLPTGPVEQARTIDGVIYVKTGGKCYAVRFDEGGNPVWTEVDAPAAMQ